LPDDDTAEMSLSFFLIAKSRIDFPYLAIPVFPHRRFFHTDLVCNIHSGIKSPEDLAGKKIAVPEYGMTGPLWIRGLLSNEFGVTPDKIDWYLERPSHVSNRTSIVAAVTCESFGSVTPPSF